MKIYHEIKPEAYIIILTGSLQGNHAQELDITLHKALKCQKKKIILDCHLLSYISSGGIGIFLAHLPEIRENEIELEFKGLSPPNRRLIEVLGLQNLVTLSD